MRYFIGTVGVVAFCLSLAACATPVTRHALAPAELGAATTTSEMERRLSEPGPVVFRRETFAYWTGGRGSFLDLGAPASVAAGIGPGPERATIYAYSLKHPRFGLYLIDAGISDALPSRLNPVMRYGLNQLAPAIEQTTVQWAAREGGPRGVFVTHLHFDHIGGLIDLPPSTTVFVGPGEAEERHWTNTLLGNPADAILKGFGPLQVWRFQPDLSGAFRGIVDVFGDGSVWALWTPGHSSGSTSYLVRTTEGPKLIVGDAVHTRLGWEQALPQAVIPGFDPDLSADSFERLKQFAERHPEIEIFLGHQPLEGQS
jgi:glyoxylase-like metal-dependent hydrolase (beta-lactamase superfamily II)